MGGYARDRSDVDCIRRVQRDNLRRSEAGEVTRAAWSWAVTTAPVTYTNLGHWIVDTASFCNDLTELIFLAVTSVQCVPETDDPTMRLKPESARQGLTGILFEPPNAVAEYVRSHEANEPYMF